MKYLDPKFDLTFKKVFAENADLMASVLNALLPLEEGREVRDVEYLPSDLLPDDQHEKLTIVDVRCRDNYGRQFLVEMQMQWQKDFIKRVAHNVAKAYASQAAEGDLTYAQNEDVYSLNFVNARFTSDDEDFLHHITLMDEKTHKHYNLFHFTFAELPKFNPTTMGEKRKTVLWLRFLTEINENTVDAPDEMKIDPDILKALGIVEKKAFSPQQLRAYDRFTDEKIRYVMLMHGKYEEGFGKGKEIGKAEGIAEGMEKGREEEKARSYAEKVEIAKKMVEKGIPISDVCGLLDIDKVDLEKEE